MTGRITDRRWSVAAKTRSPKTVGQECGLPSIPFAFFIGKAEPEFGSNPWNIQEVLRDPDPVKTLGLSLPGQGVTRVIEKCFIGAQVDEGVVACAPVRVIPDVRTRFIIHLRIELLLLKQRAESKEKFVEPVHRFISPFLIRI